MTPKTIQDNKVQYRKDQAVIPNISFDCLIAVAVVVIVPTILILNTVNGG